MARVPRSSDRGPLAKKIASSCIVHPPAFLKSNKPARGSVDFGQVSFLERQWSLGRSWYVRFHHCLPHASHLQRRSAIRPKRPFVLCRTIGTLSPCRSLCAACRPRNRIA